MLKSAMAAQSLFAPIHDHLTVVDFHLINQIDLIFVKMIWITFV